jgi:hypothetical protein
VRPYEFDELGTHSPKISRRQLERMGGALLLLLGFGGLVSCRRETTGEVTGRVRAADGSDVGRAFVFLYNRATGKYLSPEGFYIDSDGSFSVRGVPPGIWKAYCQADPALPLLTQTFSRMSGFDTDNGKPIEVRRGEIRSGVDFWLEPAGRLQVSVADPAGMPIGGVALLLYDSASRALTQLPFTTDSNGQAIIPQAPMQSKLLLAGPSGFESVWWDRKTGYLSADTISMPSPGGGLSMTVTLRMSG